MSGNVMLHNMFGLIVGFNWARALRLLCYYIMKGTIQVVFVWCLKLWTEIICALFYCKLSAFFSFFNFFFKIKWCTYYKCRTEVMMSQRLLRKPCIRPSRSEYRSYFHRVRSHWFQFLCKERIIWKTAESEKRCRRVPHKKLLYQLLRLWRSTTNPPIVFYQYCLVFYS